MNYYWQLSWLNHDRFTPEILGLTASKALAILAFEILVVKTIFYLFNCGGVPVLDLISYCGFKFVGYILAIFIAFFSLLFSYSLALFMPFRISTLFSRVPSYSILAFLLYYLLTVNRLVFNILVGIVFGGYLYFLVSLYIGVVMGFFMVHYNNELNNG